MAMTIIRTERISPDCHIIYEAYDKIIKWAVFQNELIFSLHDKEGKFLKVLVKRTTK